MTRFKNPAMQRLYDACRAIYAANSAYRSRAAWGASGGTFSAFWYGYDGEPPRYLRTPLAYAAWAAGRDAERAGR